jgi:isocitrate dehydrogenase
MERRMKKIVYRIEGDGIGPEVWRAARPVIDAAVSGAYGKKRVLDWRDLPAGSKAEAECGVSLPEATLEALQKAELAVKGPLSTPVGKGFRSLNVALRHALDLYACIRPVRWLPGTPSPVRHPERVDMVIFRENSEDVYAGIEYPAKSPEAGKLIAFLRDSLGAEICDAAAVGIKPVTESASKRLIRRALRFALERKLPSLTLMHKGNIMKYTEGAFRQWGYDVAEQEFSAETCTEQAPVRGRLVIKDRIADALFQEVLLRPEEYSVIAAPNLNGDYISDALAAQVGGLGIAPGVNMSDTLAFFEATHGTAPSLAGKDRANPTSLILCGALMLEHIGWHEAATAIENAVKKTFAARTVTADLAAQMENARCVGCAAFGELVGAAL